MALLSVNVGFFLESHTCRNKAITMTDCNRHPMLFSSSGSRQVVADFEGGSLTSDGGLLLLREVDRHLGLTAALDRCIPDPREAACVTHAQHTLLAQRVLAIAAGWEDLNDHQRLRDDPALQLAARDQVDAREPLGSPPTLCRLENRVDRPALVAMSKVLVEAFITSHKHPPKKLVLDFDATHDPIHGNQVGRHFRAYYDCYCFLPLYVFCGDHLLVAYLRSSSRGGAHHAWPILALLVKRLRQAWPKVKIVFRGDSGFWNPRMIRWCQKNRVNYIVGLQVNAVLKRLSRRTMDRARREFERRQGSPAAAGPTPQKVRLFEELKYAARGWKPDLRPRVMLRHEHMAEGPNPRYVATDLKGNIQRLYEKVYCARGDCENRIKEQMQLFADRTSCHEFLANQFRVLLSAAAYVLIEHLRRVGLAGSELAQAEAATIRGKLLKIGARVVASVRRVVLHLASGHPLAELFARAARKLRGLKRDLLGVT